MAQDELIDFLSSNRSWYLSKDLVPKLKISRAAVTRGLTKLSEQGYVIRKPLKPRGFAYRINPEIEESQQAQA